MILEQHVAYNEATGLWFKGKLWGKSPKRYTALHALKRNLRRQPNITKGFDLSKVAIFSQYGSVNMASLQLNGQWQVKSYPFSDSVIGNTHDSES